VAGQDFAAGNEADLDAKVLARRREPGQVEEEGEVESPPGLQAGGIGEHPALARLPGALAALRVEEDQLEEGTGFRDSLSRLKRLVADFEVEEDFPRLVRARDDDRVRCMEHQRQRDVASRVFLRQVTSQHVDTPFKYKNFLDAAGGAAFCLGLFADQEMGPAPIEMGPAPIEIGPAPIEAWDARPGAGKSSDEAKNPKMSKNARRKLISPPPGQVCTSPALHLLRQGTRAVLTPNARKNFGRPKAAKANRGSSRFLSSRRA
jgi:hypothetical protein